MLRRGILAIVVCALAAFAVAGCGGGDDNGSSSSSSTNEEPAKTPVSKSQESGEAGGEPTKPKVVPPKGPAPKQLESKELTKGTGPEAKAGDEVSVQYVGVDYKTGEQFDASWDRGEPFTFTLGAGEVIKGWDEGVQGMKVGGRRELVIPPQLAYGSQQVGPIAPNSTLVFVVDLVAVN